NDDHEGMDAYFWQLGKEFLELYNSLNHQPPIRVQLTSSQKKRFCEYFEGLQAKYLNLHPEEYVATVRRMGLSCFRLTMIFSALRIPEDGEISAERSCIDADFDNALAMVKVLIRHSSRVFFSL